MHDLIIIGGGAAGLWAAAVAAQRGLKTLVLEKNRKPGVKILMSGGTRCNLTQHCPPQQIVAAFGNQGRFLKPAVFALPPEAVVRQFNQLGVETKVESIGKVFPVSDRALDVRDALLRWLGDNGAELRTGIAVRDLRATTAGGARWEAVTDDGTWPARSVLLCTGGLSYPGCGTTGDGYAWARQAGHTVTATVPALAPLVSPANWVHELTGLTLPDVQVRIETGGSREKEPRRTSRGGFLWTHFGCSGPAPMNVSRFVALHQLRRAGQPGLDPATLRLDLLPDIDAAQLAQRLDASRQGKQRVASLVGDWLPQKLVHLLLDRARIASSLALAELPKAARLQLIADLKGLPIPIDETRGYAKAEVTAGGVLTSEVQPHTLESRLAPGLFLAGEILDVDGPIGGYNFQAAFATANAAAASAPASL